MYLSKTTYRNFNKTLRRILGLFIKQLNSLKQPKPKKTFLRRQQTKPNPKRNKPFVGKRLKNKKNRHRKPKHSAALRLLPPRNFKEQKKIRRNFKKTKRRTTLRKQKKRRRPPRLRKFGLNP